MLNNARKRLFKRVSNPKEKEHDKKNLEELDKILRAEITTRLSQIKSLNKLLNNQLNILGGIDKLKEYEDSFLFNKVNEALDKLDKYEAFLLKQSKKDHLRVKDLVDITEKLFNSYSTILTLKEFYYRIKDEYISKIE